MKPPLFSESPIRKLKAVKYLGMRACVVVGMRSQPFIPSGYVTVT